MDFRSVFDYTYELKEELARIQEDPSVKVPLILKLVEVEVTRLNDIMLSMASAEMKVYMDEDGLMMTERLSNVFGLSDASSVELLRNRLTDEFKVLDGYFSPPLVHIAKFIPTVIYRLDQKLSREFFDKKVGAASSAVTTGRTSRGPKPDSVGGSSSPASSHKTERQGSPQQDDILANAINTAMRDNPQDFHIDQVIGLLRQTVPDIDIDDEDVKNLIFQKCNEALESRDKKLAQGDKGESGSKKE